MCLATARDKERCGAGKNGGPEKGQTQHRQSRESGVKPHFTAENTEAQRGF